MFIYGHVVFGKGLHIFSPLPLTFTVIVGVGRTFNQSCKAPATLGGFEVLKTYLVIIFCLHILTRYDTSLKLNVQTL